MPFGLESEALVRDYTPVPGSERENSVFTSVHPACSPYSAISSGMVTPTLGPQHPTKPDPLQPLATGLPHRYDDYRQGLQHQVQQQLTATWAYRQGL